MFWTIGSMHLTGVTNGKNHPNASQVPLDMNFTNRSEIIYLLYSARHITITDDIMALI